MTSLETLRTIRLGNYAIFDLVASFIGIFLLAPIFSNLSLKIGLNIPKKNWLFLTLPLGILIHLITGTYTQMTKDFINPNGQYLIKSIILLSLFFGIKGISLVKKSIIKSTK